MQATTELQDKLTLLFTTMEARKASMRREEEEAKLKRRRYWWQETEQTEQKHDEIQN